MLLAISRLTARETIDGSDVRIKRLFPGNEINHFDPFVLFDEFFLTTSAGFPLHPHRGFEAVTYMLEGGFHHTDTVGNDSTVCIGGVQYFSAGKGIEHSEMPGTEGLNHGIQLWVNLPRDLKKMDPEYHQVDAQNIPTREDDDTVIRTIIGTGSPVRLHTAVTYLDVILKAQRQFVAEIPEAYNGILYVISGEILIKDEVFGQGEAFLMDDERIVPMVSKEHSRVIFLSGQPHHQTIRQHGSFVD
jgi:redox-sensitive bicupin YhaK (pirin superfamily)